MLNKKAKQFMSEVRNHFPDLFMKDRAEFDGYTGSAIWTSGESGVFEYDCDYGGDYVDPKMQALLDKYDLYWEWYDPGTVMIYTA